jgi:hypothetical protein
MKRILTYALAVALTLSLSGCSLTGVDEDEPLTAPSVKSASELPDTNASRSPTETEDLNCSTELSSVLWKRIMILRWSRSEDPGDYFHYGTDRLAC